MSPGEIARALGGEVVRGAVLAPEPGHSRADRSLSVKLSPQSPTGVLVYSHAGDDWRLCRDYVAQRLGITDKFEPNRRRLDLSFKHQAEVAPGSADSAARIARAVALWQEARDPRGTMVERYLASRGLELDEVVAGVAIRFHSACPWREGEVTIRVPAMIAAMRSITTDAIRGIHRTRLTDDGHKVDRRMLGIAAGAAVKLDADDTVTLGLTVGEGVETVLAARQLGFRPAWALASAGAVAAFPVLGGVEALTLLAEADPAGQRSAQECGARWDAARREVTIVEPRSGADVNDAIRGAA